MNDSIRRLEKKEKGKKPTGEKITGGCDGLAKFNKNQFPPPLSSNNVQMKHSARI